MKPLLLLCMLCHFFLATTAQTIPLEIRTLPLHPTLPANEKKGSSMLKNDGDAIDSDDFSTPANWTINSVAGAFVIGDNATPEISSNMDLGIMSSTTAANGFASFNGSQYIQTNDFSPKNTQLISPTIDLTGISFIEIAFEQRFRKYDSEQTLVELSEDGGTTWVTLGDVNANVITSASIQNTVVLRAHVTGSATTLIRFRWSGIGFGWSIDDLSISEGYVNNLSLTEGFALIGPEQLAFSQIPVNQIQGCGQPLLFKAFVENTGYIATDGMLHVTAPGYDYTSAVENISSLQNDTLVVGFDAEISLQPAIGTVDFQLNLSALQTLSQTEDDQLSIPLEITDDIYAVDSYDGTVHPMDAYLFLTHENPVGTQGIGPVFQIFSKMTVTSIDVGIAPIQASEHGTYTGREFVVVLYTYSHALQQWEYYTESAPYILTSFDFGHLIHLYIDPVTFNPGTIVAAVAISFEDFPVPFAFSGNTSIGTVLGINNNSEFFFTVADSQLHYTPAPIVRLIGNSISQAVNSLILTAYQTPSVVNNCTGHLTINAEGNPTYLSSVNGGSEFVHSSPHVLNNLCPGVYSLQTVDFCGNDTTVNFVITTDTNYLFNNPFGLSNAEDSIGTAISNCDLDYTTIDTAYIDSIWANGNQVTAIWNITDSQGAHLDTITYTLTSGNGTYFLQLNSYCLNSPDTNSFSVSEAIIYHNGTITSVGVSENSLESYHIFPNPSINYVSIQTNTTEPVKLEVTDAQDKLVLEELILQQKTISLESLRSGMYLFRLQSLKCIEIKRVVKN